jgi:transposase-like protein
MNTDMMLSTSETAERLGVRPQTLRKWRLLGKGPCYVRLGASPQARVSYSLEAVQEWLDAHTFRSTSEETAALSVFRPNRDEEWYA